MNVSSFSSFLTLPPDQVTHGIPRLRTIIYTLINNKNSKNNNIGMRYNEYMKINNIKTLILVQREAIKR